MQVGTEEDTRTSEAVKAIRAGVIPVFSVRVVRSFGGAKAQEDFEQELAALLLKYKQIDPYRELDFVYERGNPGMAFAAYEKDKPT